MRLYVLLAHADPSVAPRYRAALEAAGVDAVVLAFVAPGKGLSSRYTALASDVRAGGRVLPGLLRRYPAPGPYDALVLATYSAGYALAREVLRSDADRAELAGWIGLDSLHANERRPGVPDPAQMAPFIALAREAREGRRLCWIGHSDVDPVTYASTTETAAAVLRAAGGEGGLLHVEGFDVARDAAEEHRRALTHWGPDFVARACAALLRGQQGAPEQAAPMVEPAAPAVALGAALLEAARADLGVRETGGANRGPEIDAALRAVGAPVGSAWCAAMLTRWLRRAAEAAGVPSPIPGSAGAKAIGSQLVQAGRWGDARELAGRVGPGWIVVWHRGAPGAWTGHVGVVEAVQGDEIVTIEANSGPATDRVARMRRRLDDPMLLGGGWVG
jgi:hypothetical protein